MFWETLWASGLGFGLSGAVQAFVSRDEMQRRLGDHRPAAVGRAFLPCAHAPQKDGHRLPRRRLLRPPRPPHVWNDVFIHGHGNRTTLESVIVGPLVAVISFVCSIGNVHLAAAHARRRSLVVVTAAPLRR